MEQLKKDIDKYIGILTEINEEIQIENNTLEIKALVEEIKFCVKKVYSEIDKYSKKI